MFWLNVSLHDFVPKFLDTNDFLVYAPWCGHCKALAPKYDELGELFKPYGDKVIIAKVDATANDVPDDIQGFPTIKLFVAGKKDAPVNYSGARTIEDLAAFVKDNGKYAVDAYVKAEPSTVAETVVEAVEEIIGEVAGEPHDEL
jgi:protein disulfide-isomerase A1